jgi:hypothetical protein
MTVRVDCLRGSPYTTNGNPLQFHWEPEGMVGGDMIRRA